MTNDNTEKVVWLFEAQNKDVLRKLSQIERQTKGSFQKSSKHVKSFNLQMQKGAALAKGFASNLAGFGGVAVVGSIAGLGNAIQSVVSQASMLAKTADKIGMTTDELQRLQYGFELAGVAERQTNVALQRFSRRVAQAANGSGELYEILKQNGVALRDQEGNMRRQVDILADYAGLVKNAKSSQEQLLLAFKAFDTEGASLVNALRKGREGMQELMGAANDAGGVLDEKILRKAEEIDDEFARLSRTIGVNLKSAILDMSAELNILLGTFRDLDRRTESNIRQEMAHLQETMARWDGIDIFGVGDQARIDLLRRELMRRALENGPAQLQDSTGWLRGEEETESNYPPTIIPTKPNKGKGSNPTRDADAVRDRIAALQAEFDAIGQTALQQRIMNELRGAGAMATEAQKAKIQDLVKSIEEGKSKQESWNYVQQQTEQLAMTGFSQFTNQIRTGNDALDQFLQTMIKVSMQAAIFGTGSMAGLFGGGISRLFGFDQGGYTGNGSASAVAGVVHGGEFVFSKVAVDRLGLSNLDALHKNAKGYANGGFVGPHGGPASVGSAIQHQRTVVQVVNSAPVEVKFRNIRADHFYQVFNIPRGQGAVANDDWQGIHITECDALAVNKFVVADGGEEGFGEWLTIKGCHSFFREIAVQLTNVMRPKVEGNNFIGQGNLATIQGFNSTFTLDKSQYGQINHNMIDLSAATGGDRFGIIASENNVNAVRGTAMGNEVVGATAAYNLPASMQKGFNVEH